MPSMSSPPLNNIAMTPPSQLPNLSGLSYSWLASPTGGSPASPASNAGPKILVAEDNNMNQLILRRMLNTLGYMNVKIVGNGKEAVDAVRSERFELILMDIMV